MVSYRLGHLVIALEGSGRVFMKVMEEVSGNLPKTDEAPHVTFRFERLPAVDFRQNGQIFVHESGIRVSRGGGLTYDVAEQDNGLLITVESASSSRSKIKAWLRRAKDWNYLYKDEEYAKNFMYNVFDWATHVEQLRQRQSYIHASSMVREDRGIAVLGWGGVGKTTTLLKLCLEDGWRFLSDDLGLVDTSGTLFRTPKRLQIYGYNTLNQPGIADHLLRGRSLADRLSWTYRFRRFGPKKVRRRIGAVDFFGRELIADQARLTDIIYLERTSASKPELLSISSEEIANRMAAVVMAEIEPYSELHRQARAAGVSFLKSPEELEADTKATLVEAFSGVPATLIRVGDNPEPNLLAELIRDYVRNTGAKARASELQNAI